MGVACLVIYLCRITETTGNAAAASKSKSTAIHEVHEHRGRTLSFLIWGHIADMRTTNILLIQWLRLNSRKRSVQELNPYKFT